MPRRLFGTNGIRGIANKDLTPEQVLNIGLAIGSALQPNTTIIIGRDARVSGIMIETALVSALTSLNVNIIDVGVVATPAIQMFCKKNKMFGIMITASHNPPEYNGIKCIAPDGTELDRADEEMIEQLYFSKKFRNREWDKIGTVQQYTEVNHVYLQEILKKVNVQQIKKQHFKVVVDCANGVASLTTPILLRKLGCHVTTLNANLDGYFSAHSSEPKPENLAELMNFMKNNEFDLGIAHDGDADRAIFLDENGNYIQGDKVLALMGKYLISDPDTIFVTPVSTSNVVETVVHQQKGTVVYTKIGAPIVARTMIKTDAKLGGEENGGIIFAEHQYCRDGAMAVAKILEIMTNTGKKISELVAELPKYYQAKDYIKVQASKKLEIMAKLIKKLQDKKHELIDGIKIFEEHGWVLIRPSGTEDIIRIYVDATSAVQANAMKEKYKAIVSELL